MRRFRQPEYLARLGFVFIFYTATIYLFYYFTSDDPANWQWLPMATVISALSFVGIVVLVNFGPLLLASSRLSNKAQEATQRGDHRLAAQYYNEALQRRPNHADLLLGRGQARMMFGDISGALADFTATIEATPYFLANAPSPAYDAYLARANIYLELGDVERAIREVGGAIQMYPQRESGYLLRALCYRRLNRYAEAIADLTTTLAANPQSPVAHNNRGYLYYLAGNLPAAASDLAQAVTLAPRMWQTHYHLAQVQVALGQNEPALVSLRRAGAISRQPLVQARSDAAFVPLQARADFQQLVGGYAGPSLTKLPSSPPLPPAEG